MTGPGRGGKEESRSRRRGRGTGAVRQAPPRAPGSVSESSAPPRPPPEWTPARPLPSGERCLLASFQSPEGEAGAENP